MANHRSAIKRHRQNLKRRARNRHYRSTVRNAVKAFRTLQEEGAGADELKAAFTKAESAIRRASSKGVYHARTASRTIGRLAGHLHGAVQGDP